MRRCCRGPAGPGQDAAPAGGSACRRAAPASHEPSGWPRVARDSVIADQGKTARIFAGGADKCQNDGVADEHAEAQVRRQRLADPGSGGSPGERTGVAPGGCAVPVRGRRRSRCPPRPCRTFTRSPSSTSSGDRRSLRGTTAPSVAPRRPRRGADGRRQRQVCDRPQCHRGRLRAHHRRGDRPDRLRRPAQRRCPGHRPGGRDSRRQTHQRPDPAVSPACAQRRRRRLRRSESAGDRHHRVGAHHRPHRRRDGGADRGHGGGPDASTT